jgi:phosphoadenosine phosphosulfate reductase
MGMKDLFGHDKLEMSIERLKMFCPPEGYYGAFSGGKDSCVIKELSMMAEIKVDWHYNVTTIDQPELIYFIRKHHADVEFRRPQKPFLTLMIDRGFPMRINRWCCQEYKEGGGSGRRVMTGIRAQESLKRAGRKMVEQCYRDSSKTYVNPIIDWSESDVWTFIRERAIPYCSLYDEGFKRIGCIMCCYNYNRKIEAERWPKVKALFIKAFVKLYEKNKDHHFNRKIYDDDGEFTGEYRIEYPYSRWKSGKEMFDWWLSKNGGGKGNPDQFVIFE